MMGRLLLVIALPVAASCVDAPTSVTATDTWLVASVVSSSDCNAQLGECLAQAAQQHRGCIADARASFSGSERAAAIGFCHSAFAEDRVTCEGASNCETACQATYDADAAQCIVLNDPSICGGDPVCEEDVLLHQGFCLARVQQDLDDCIDGCAATQP